ncbi:PAS domain-containing protein [Candidatus Sumerlaeota bacterium]|nr:PAS domain-containing protein [Candidatus Sumerlaeota bacterium]
MEAKKSGFEDKFLSKLGKIDPRRIRDYLAQLLSRKNFFETIFDHLGEGIIVTDGQQRVIYVNQIARQILLWPARKSMLGETLVERCPEGQLKDTLAIMFRQPRRVEGYECAFGPNNERRLLLTSIPINPALHEGPSRRESDAAEVESMWVFILSDVTERSRRMDEQARSQRLASLSLLTSGVAHEIKNPLNSLNIHAQILQQEARDARERGEGLDTTKAERAAGVILEETGRLTEIINEFIQAARPQSPMIERKFMNRIIEDLVRVFGPECVQAGIELRTDLEPELPPIDMDANLIFQALRNLVRNAIDAHLDERRQQAGESKGQRMILLRTRLAGENMTVEVVDNGPGIGEESIDKIFEPYYTTKAGGTGLGLMVVYRIVTEHQGSIHVDSHPGLGTRFLVTLPLVERPIRLLGSPQDAGASVST